LIEIRNSGKKGSAASAAFPFFVLSIQFLDSSVIKFEDIEEKQRISEDFGAISNLNRGNSAPFRPIPADSDFFELFLQNLLHLGKVSVTISLVIGRFAGKPAEDKASEAVAGV